MSIERSIRPWSSLSAIRAGLASVSVARIGEESDFREFLSAREAGCAALGLGGGTNLVGADDALPLELVRLSRDGFTYARRNGTRVTAGAAWPLASLLRRMAENGLGGLSALSGIPGSLGGALAGNAGANGMAIFDAIGNIRGISLQDGTSWHWSAGDGGFSYRTSPVPKHVMVLEATLLFTECSADGELSLQTAEAERRRRASAPFPSLGSTFRNPEGHSAGKLLEDAGCRGLSRGAFSVYEKHCNWIVNTSGKPGSAADYRALLEEMRRRVQERHGILLHPEVRFAGDFARPGV